MKYSSYNIFIELSDGDLLLVNTFSGAMFKVSEETRRKITEDSFDLQAIDFQQFQKTGIIIDDKIDELRYISHMNSTAKFKSNILSVTVLLTMDCNFKCTYCYEGTEDREILSLSPDSCNRIYKFIQNILNTNHNLNTVHLILFGGEPLLHFRIHASWIDSIKELSESMGKSFSTSIVTNGSLIDDFVMERLIAFNCRALQISLDGVKEIHDARRIRNDGGGTFDTVMAGIKKAYSYKSHVPLIVRINIDRTNYQQIDSLLTQMLDEGLDGCRIDFGIVRGYDYNKQFSVSNCFSDAELSEIMPPIWESAYSKGFSFSVKPVRRSLYCGCHSDMSFTIKPNGELYSCWEFVGDKDQMFGVIDENGYLPNLGYSYFDWITRHFSDSEMCLKCKFIPICMGGCAAIGYNRDDNIHQSGCFMTKSLFKAQTKFFYEHFMQNSPDKV